VKNSGTPAAGRAKELRKQARNAEGEGRLTEAVALFQEAWALDHDWESVCELARVEKNLARAPAAAASYRRCWHTMPENVKAALGEQVKLELAKLLTQVGTLDLESNVPGAEVVVDGEVVATMPLEQPLYVYAGQHSLLVRKPGYEPDARFIDVRPGGNIKQFMRLQRTGSPDSSAPEEWKVEAPSEPEKPATPAKRPPAKVPEETPSPALQPQCLPEAASKQPVSPSGPSAVNGEARPVMIAVGLGVSAVGIALGISGLVAGAGTRGDVDTMYGVLKDLKGDNSCTAYMNNGGCSDVHDMLDRANALRVMGVGGLVLFAAGGVLVSYELGRVNSSGTTVSPQAGLMVVRGGGALAITGKF